MAAVVQKLLAGTVATIGTLTELSALGSGSLALCAAYSNTIGGTGDGYTNGRIQIATFPSTGTVTANSGFSIWFVKSVDGGGTYEGGAAGATAPTRAPDLVIPANTSTTSQAIQ